MKNLCLSGVIAKLLILGSSIFADALIIDIGSLYRSETGRTTYQRRPLGIEMNGTPFSEREIKGDKNIKKINK